MNRKQNYVTWIIVYIKTKDIYVDIAKLVETRFDTSNYELEKPLPKGKSHWINEKRIKWENNERVCSIKNKNI